MFESLLTQSSGPRVDPETLEMLGRKASQMYQQQGVPLNQAVAQVVADQPDIGNEHIKRIVEFANTVTFQEMFQGSEDKNVHFDIADPGVILRDLKDGGTPSHDGKPLSMSDYTAPPKTQEAGAPDVEQLFSQQFTSGGNGGTTDMPKVASVRVDHELHADPIEDVYDTHVRLKATREKLASSFETMHMLLNETKEELYQEVKQQVLDPYGAGLGGVVGALEKVADHVTIHVLLGPMIDRMIEERIPADLNTSLEKRAGSVVNYQHPLLAKTDAIVKLASEMVVCEKAIDDVDGMLEQTMGVLKQAGAMTTGVKKAVGSRGKVPGALRQRFPRKS